MQSVQRLELLTRLQEYITGNDPGWQAAKERAFRQNAWFIPEFIDLAARNIAMHLLHRQSLARLTAEYDLENIKSPKTVGVVMPGHIPLAGFCDFCFVFLSGHRQRIRLSPKDDVLLKHLVMQLADWDDTVWEYVSFEDMLKGCDAYIVGDGSNARPMQQYFSKYPNIIRTPKRAEAVLDGTESREQLELLADDVFHYFGQGYLNISKIYVPQGYDFIPLLKVFDRYHYLADHNKYKNNFDYQLSLLILNKEFYMTNGCILLTENSGNMPAVSRLYFEYGTGPSGAPGSRSAVSVPGKLVFPAAFGMGQRSVVCQDGPATLQFLREL